MDDWNRRMDRMALRFPFSLLSLKFSIKGNSLNILGKTYGPLSSNMFIFLTVNKKLLYDHFRFFPRIFLHFFPLLLENSLFAFSAFSEL